MTDPLAVATHHLERGRTDLAERELRAALTTDPESGMTHAMLAVCLTERGESKHALAEIDEALRRMPAHAGIWRIRSSVLLRLDRFDDAEVAAVEAIRLAPGEAAGFIARGEVRFAAGRMPEALADIDKALAINPADAHAHDLKARLLTLLGRGDEAAVAGREALRLEPESAGAHAALGWQLLHAGDRIQAQDEFREALRLDPLMNWARLGLIEALKARNPVYRQLLQLLLWIARSSVARSGTLVAGVIGIVILKTAAITDPRVLPVVGPVLIIYFLALVASWIARPLFNAALRLSSDGRFLLTAEERRESSLVVAALGAGTVLAFAWPLTDDPAFALAGACTGMLSLLVCGIRAAASGWRRSLVIMLATASVPAMLAGLTLVLLGEGDRPSNTLPAGDAALLLVAPALITLGSFYILYPRRRNPPGRSVAGGVRAAWRARTSRP